MEEEDFEEVWAAARGYNQTFEQNSILSDAFGIDEAEHIEDTEYWKVLNVAGDGGMGYLSIPKINIRLAIYHGTSEEVLQTGVGHLNGTRLPVGGREQPYGPVRPQRTAQRQAVHRYRPVAAGGSVLYPDSG